MPPSQRVELPIPRELDAIVLACLVKSPADRMRSAAELRRALASVNLPPWGDEQAARWWSTMSTMPPSSIGA